MSEVWRQGYLRYFNAWLNAKSNCISFMITGPSNFPARRHEKINRSENNRYEDLRKYHERATRAISRMMFPTLHAIRSDNPDATALLAQKIAEAEQFQDACKAANKIVRAKLSDEEKCDKLRLLGFSDKRIHEILTPNYLGQIGVEPFTLTNNSANIRRMKDRLAQLQREQVKPEAAALTFEGGRIEEDKDAMRLRVYFDAIPGADLRSKLKAQGFKWAPSVGAWQRLLNDNARYAVKRILGIA